MAQQITQNLNEYDLLLSNVMNTNEKKLQNLEIEIDESKLDASWDAFGDFIVKSLRQNKGVTINKFGTFTFSAPEVTLNGVTNPNQRDKQLRQPVFIVSKEFVKGAPLKSGLAAGGSIRPYAVSGSNGQIQQTKINYTEIGLYCNLDKDIARVCIERYIKSISDRVRKESSVQVMIPHVGQFIVRNNVVAIRFLETLWHEARSLSNKTLKLRDIYSAINPSRLSQGIQRGSSQQSRRLNSNEDKSLEIDLNATEWLKKNLEIDIQSIQKSQIRPQTSKNREDRLNFSGIRPSSSQKIKNQNVQQDRISINGSTIKFADILKGSTNTQKSPTNQNLLSDTQSSKQRQRRKIDDKESAMNKVTFWMRYRSLSNEDTFFEIIKQLFGASAHKSMKLTIEQLGKAIEAIGINLTNSELREFFESIDTKKDNLVDIEEWTNNIITEDNLLQNLKDVVFKNRLLTDDVLKRMNLDYNQTPLTHSDLKAALTRLDQHLNHDKASRIAKSILKDKISITVSELVDVLGCTDDKNLIDENWIKSTLRKIKRTLIQNKKPDALREEFEKWDNKNQGRLDTANFKSCLIRLKFELSVHDINRLVRYLDKDNEMMIDYNKFLELIHDVVDHATEKEGFVKLAEQISQYMRNNKMNSQQFLHKIQKIHDNQSTQQEDSKKIKNEIFAEFIKQNYIKKLQKQNPLFYAEHIDIDNDGYIDKNDIETFLDRNHFLEEYFKAQEAQSNGHFSGAPIKQVNLFPTVPLSESKSDMVLRDFRQALNERRISYNEVFKILDKNQDGFLTFTELSEGLDKIIKLSNSTKEGLFAYLDKQKIGLVDYPTFLAFLKKSANQKQIEVTEDNWDWQNQIIQLIRKWHQEKNITAEDAFRTIDVDFDGFVSKEDLARFLKEFLRLPEDEVTSPRVDRLFKLMDQFKRGIIQLCDFKRILQEDFENGNNMTISGGRSLIGRSTFDWRINAKQQIGLRISQMYLDVQTSFDEISGHKNRLTYEQFQQWIEKSRALFGFNLTDKLLQQLFSDLDPHKKGYLTSVDWTNQFGRYNWCNQMINEVEDVLVNNFNDIKTAFKYFYNSGNKRSSLDNGVEAFQFENFKTAVNSLIPTRFSLTEIQTLWKKIGQNSALIDFSRFCLTFDSNKFKNKQIIQNQRPITALTLFKGDFSSAKSLQRLAEDPFSGNVVDKVQSILRSSNKSLEQAFLLHDTDNIGKISNKQFRAALRNLNLGLTLTEIDQLLNLCDIKPDGLIEWREFSKNFQLKDIDSRIIQRSKNRIDKLKENIYSYLLSPKDAFRFFNEDNTGKMTFDQFNKLVVRLYQLSGEESPSFSIIKDLFDYIDIRKDGIIDMAEWLQTFIKTTSLNVQTKEYSKQYSVSKLHKSLNFAKKYDSTEWESLKEHDEILKSIGRNRKVLLQRFADLQKLGVVISQKIATQVIHEVLQGQNLIVPQTFWPLLFKFAEKDGAIDYKFLFEVYRERMQIINTHPKDKNIKY